MNKIVVVLFLLLSFSSIFAQEAEGIEEATPQETSEQETETSEEAIPQEASEEEQIDDKDAFEKTGDFLVLKPRDLSSTNYITYDSYINSIKDRLPSIQLNLLNVESSEIDLLREEGAGDINLDANLGLHGSQGERLSILPVPTSTGVGPATSIGVGSLIPYSGTRWNLTLTNTTIFYSGTDLTQYKPTINLSVSQPLLKNMFGKSDRYRIEDARFAVEIENDTSTLSNNNLLVAYQKIYYQWIGLEKNLTITSQALDNAKTLEAQTLRRYRSGIIDNDSYQLSRAQTFQYMDLLTQHEEDILSLINTLGFFITNTGVIRPDHQQWNVNLTIATEEEPEFIPFNQSTYGLLANKNGERIANDIAIQKNLTLPDLSLVAGVGVSADDFNSGYIDSISKMTNVDYFVGFKFSYPIGDRVSRANYEQAQLELEQFNMQYRNMVLDYNTRMKDTILRYEAILAQIETKQSRIKSLESALATQRTKYNQGRLELLDILETENSILTEKLSLTDLEFQLINNYFDYKELFSITHYL